MKTNKQTGSGCPLCTLPHLSVREGVCVWTQLHLLRVSELSARQQVAAFLCSLAPPVKQG